MCLLGSNEKKASPGFCEGSLMECHPEIITGVLWDGYLVNHLL